MPDTPASVMTCAVQQPQADYLLRCNSGGGVQEGSGMRQGGGS